MATLTTAVWTERRELQALRDTISGLEVRVDLTGDLNPDMIRAHVGGDLIYSLRSIEAGGAFAGPAEERVRRLVAAATSYDLVDLEADRDLVPEVLAGIPPQRRRICWYGPGRDSAGLFHVFAAMAHLPARMYLLAPEAQTVEHALAPLHLLRQLNRPDVTAFASGELGAISRLLAPWFGAPVVFGGLGHSSAHGLLTIERLRTDYPFPALPPLANVFGIIGQRVGESQSPRLHNDAYRATGFPALYLPMHLNEFTDSWPALAAEFERLGVSFRGVTVVAPFKEEALRLADTMDPEARRSGAANLLVHRPDGWQAHTTDPSGVVGAIGRSDEWLAGREVAVVGCGGAGRGAVLGLLRAGARPVVVNRSAVRGRYAARLLGVDYLPLRDFEPEDYSLIVHATPVRGAPPFSVDRVRDGAIVVDLAYGPQPTELVTAARRRRRLHVVDGWRVLSVEVASQFKLMTGKDFPVATQPVEAGSEPAALSDKEFVT